MLVLEGSKDHQPTVFNQTLNMCLQKKKTQALELLANWLKQPETVFVGSGAEGMRDRCLRIKTAQIIGSPAGYVVNGLDFTSHYTMSETPGSHDLGVARLPQSVKRLAYFYYW